MTGSIPPSGPLSYEGQVAVPYIVKTFDPLPTNNKFPLPTVWVNSEDKTAFISVSKDFGSTEWVPIGGIPGEAESLTGNDSVIVHPTSGNINVLGNTSTGLTFTGAGSTLTGTLNAIPNSALSNSSITVGAGTGIGVSVSPVSLGGSTSISAHIAQAAASSILANVGVASFNSADFSVDGNGFVSSNAVNDPLVITTQTFTTSGTYTPTAGMQYCIVEVLGGGGGGGGMNAASAGEVGAGGGGGGGGYARGLFTAGDIGASKSVTIGAAGSAGPNTGGVSSSGGQGGTTSLGALISATGGEGGQGATTGNASNGDGGLGGLGSGGNIQTRGQAGGQSFADITFLNSTGGFGGSSFFGGGAKATASIGSSTTPGVNGSTFGGGGSGACGNGGGAQIGGAGASGLVVVTEFSGNGGGGGVSTIAGDSGSITGSSLTIKSGTSTRNCGSSVSFVNSGTISTLNITDDHANILMGINAGNASVSGVENTGLGYGALTSITTGGTNTGIGAVSLADCISGQNNTGIGFETLPALTTGNGNTACGASTLNSLGTGSSNTAIGLIAGSSYTGSESNNILIRSIGVEGESNILRVGQATGASGNAVNKAFIQGIHNNDSSTFSGPLAVFVDSTTGQLGYGSSSGTDLHVCKFIVSPGGVSDGANYTTISSAIAAASAGDTIYVMDGTYVEDLTLKSGVNIVSLSSFQNFYGCQGNAVISGNLTDNGVGVGCNILGLSIVSTSGFAITTTAPGGISLTNCRISCTNSSLVSMNDVLSNIFFDNCFIVLATTGISLYNITTGDLWLNNSFVYNTGGTVTLPTMTPGGAVEIVNSSISAPLACSGASGISIRNSICSVDGVSAVTTSGTASANIRNCTLSTGGGAFSVLSIGSGTTITATNNTVISSATNVFTGSGTINTAGNACTNSSGNNVSTINHLTVI